LFVMFLFAYRKQTRYITKRVEANQGTVDKEMAKAVKVTL